MTMAPMTLADDVARGHIQRRQQRRGPVANVVVCLSGRDAQAHRQQGARTIQGLDLITSLDGAVIAGGSITLFAVTHPGGS
jgi:hypothetical protein